MFRLLHLGSRLGFNMVKGLIGGDCQHPSDIMRQMGGVVYDKATQATSLTDPESAVYSECVPWDRPQLQQRLRWYCAQRQLDSGSFVYIASGSVGAVFRGPPRADGSDWVVKIQYAGIKEQFEADMRAITAAGALVLSTGRQTVLQQTYDLFQGEFDYDQERVNLERVRAIWSATDLIQVPVVLASACDAGVLAMSYMPGTPLHRYVGKHRIPLPTGVEMTTLADRLVDFVIGTWSHGLVFADPHWGNFLVGEQGALQVVDFGAVFTLQDEGELTLPEVHHLVQEAGAAASFRTALAAHPVSSRTDLDQACTDFFPLYSFFHTIMDGSSHSFDEDLMAHLQPLLESDMKSYVTPGFTAVTRSLLMTVAMLSHMTVAVNLGRVVARYVRPVDRCAA
jgi:predicted unusual protein kinase regulating ubiquinone biosynthesis (AarF/ABC1/UbiB family)